MAATAAQDSGGNSPSEPQLRPSQLRETQNRGEKQQISSRRLLLTAADDTSKEPPYVTIDDLPGVPVIDCKPSVIASAFSGCGQGPNSTCCSSIDTAFGPASGKSSRNCLCFAPVVAAAQDDGLPYIKQVLAGCKIDFQLATSWAGEDKGSCPVLPTLGDPYLWRSLAPNVICLILIYTLGSWAMEMLLSKHWRPFRKMDIVKQRNFITYIWEVVVMTVALAITLAFGSELLFRNRIGSVANYSNSRIVYLLLATLYVFELSYRIKCGVSLAAHHLLCILMMLLLVFSTFDTAPSIESKTVQRVGFLISLHATTEQPTFIGLILHRMGSRHASLVLKVSTWQYLAFKLFFHVATFAVYFFEGLPNNFRLGSASRSSTNWEWTWAALIPILDVALLGPHLWCAYVLHKLAVRSSQISRRGDESESEAKKDSVSPEETESRDGTGSHGQESEPVGSIVGSSLESGLDTSAKDGVNERNPYASSYTSNPLFIKKDFERPA